MRDCFFLVADLAMQTAFEAVLTRPDRNQALGTGDFLFETPVGLDILQNPGPTGAGGYTDGGVVKHAGILTLPKVETHRHVVVCVDKRHSGSGSASSIRTQIASGLRKAGWKRAQFEILVIQPELERWLWMDHPACESAFEFDREARGGRSMRQLLEQQGQWRPHEDKPHDCDKALGITHRWRGYQLKPKALFKRLLPNAPINLCTDPEFVRLRSALQRWFPPAP